MISKANGYTIHGAANHECQIRFFVKDAEGRTVLHSYLSRADAIRGAYALAPAPKPRYGRACEHHAAAHAAKAAA